MNAEIGSAIWARLKGGTALTALLGEGTASVFVDHAPDNAEMPFVVINQQSGLWDYTMDQTRFQNALWQVRAVSGSAYPKEAEAIDAQIDARLHNASLTISGHGLLRCVRESDVRFPEIEGNQVIQHVGAMYRVDVYKS